jgi:hypothetical protein
MTDAQTPSVRFKNMVMELGPSRWSLKLTDLSRWARSQNTASNSTEALSCWLDELANWSNGLTASEFTKITLWSRAHLFNTDPLFRTIVNRGLALHPDLCGWCYDFMTTCAESRRSSDGIWKCKALCSKCKNMDGRINVITSTYETCPLTPVGYAHHVGHGPVCSEPVTVMGKDINIITRTC